MRLTSLYKGHSQQYTREFFQLEERSLPKDFFSTNTIEQGTFTTKLTSLAVLTTNIWCTVHYIWYVRGSFRVVNALRRRRMACSCSSICWAFFFVPKVVYQCQKTKVWFGFSSYFNIRFN